ncbi:MAG: GTPase [Microcystis sp.]|jgi:predicted GTPase|uniref:GTPase n=1 Tax=unclassified Microcystis TaxID=2643300 RepID=UPI0022C9D809|nr:MULTISPECIES: GTPase [unclassified Microcystis]MCA2657886.1 50S ribosome-binding GTPase [Microcystis sp. M049S2]MCZ8067818.1 50S ribosome-binding GTPase [Microcystis sp. LE17-20D]MCZ8162896.1 50S ribosome-binding GTPase [Microcystis sp. LE19-196.1B]MCZ8274951.1 50S ribosome-binding GTPase [Microcystis sp. LE19-4.1E]
MFGLRKNKAPIRLVVGLNQVDKMIPNAWNERMNMPEERAANEIARKCNDLTKLLTKYAEISTDNIEYYSALKRYRLLPLLTKIISNAYAGFKLDNVQPADPFELADPEVKAFADQQRREREAKKSGRTPTDKDRMFEEMKKILSEDDLNLVLDKFRQERSLPPKVAIFGKAGVGKTTTINSLFNAKWKTSHTIVGTTSAQMKEFELSTGGTLSVVDLPGYGRSLAEDREYEKIYQDTIPSCDLVLLIVQADAKDLADDEEMIVKVAEWLKDAPTPQR